MKLLFILILGISLGSSVRAETQVVEALILGGAKTEEEAERLIQQFNLSDAAKVKPAPKFPKVLSADELPGTPEGTYVAVLGFCDRPETKKLVSQMIRVISTGAFSQQTTGKHANECPTLAPELIEKPAASQPKRKTKR